MLTNDPLWYKDAIIYELHIKAFFDSNDDGVGDFAGLIQKLDYLERLGVTCIWLLPFYPSPLRDDGYDIADYHGINPSYGTRKQFHQFVREAHKRGMRVVTELVINHTSDQHPWFQAARRAPAGSSKRNFYVWSDDNTKYPEVRIIFTDTETSNWTWDPVAKQFYWHRFFHHQPDLNYDNPHVLRAVIKVMRFWLDMGVDGLRLDAIPYLIEREGTNCENLTESHDIVKQIRAEMDLHYRDKMLLAEANQWPADVLPYFGDNDECQMAFHFPLMPRIYVALRQEDRHPIVEIMRQTPEIPADCQWAIFLRNHDELTLEMVTDTERDYMYKEYAADPRMRLNLGIRRRLAPLVNNSRLRLELLNALMLSMPGTPVMYYGDEIGMGDNIYLGDRNGVRTPMQWTGDRNAGFSRADFARLYAPPVIDPVFGYQSINVEAQEREASSLLSWMKRIIALRKRYKAFGRGTIEFLSPENRKILVYLRKYENEIILCVANLSRFVQPVALDLSAYRGMVPVEMFGRVKFPTIGDDLYPLTVGPTGFIWFQLETAQATSPGLPEIAPAPAVEELPAVVVPAGWETLMEGKVRAVLERSVLPRFMLSQRWFGSKSLTLETLSIRDWIPIVSEPVPAFLVTVRAYYNNGKFDLYLIPLAIAVGAEAEAITKGTPKAVIAQVEGPKGAGIIYDATASDLFCTRLFDLIAADKEQNSKTGRLRGIRTSSFPDVSNPADLQPLTRGSVEQSNTTILFGNRFLMKVFRKLESGVNPDFEIGRFLTEKTSFDRVPKMLGALEGRTGLADPATLAILQEFVPNQGQGWEWMLGVLNRYFEQVVGESQRAGLFDLPANLDYIALSDLEPSQEVLEVLGGSVHSAEVLGKRTAEMHLALASDPADPAFAPEPFLHAEYLSHWMRLGDESDAVFKMIRGKLPTLDPILQPLAQELLAQGPKLVERIGKETDFGNDSLIKIRCHGDYHLGQILWQENDFIILDFEGEPGRSIADRRAKQSPWKDVAGMLRSFDYAAYSELLTVSNHHPEAYDKLEPMARFWSVWISAMFLKSYRKTVAAGGLEIGQGATASKVLNLFVLEKLIFELRYEANYRPLWLRIPLLGLLGLSQEKK